MEFGEEQKSSSLWNKLSEMITGPDHEYVYLRRIISKMNEYYRQEDIKNARYIKKIRMQSALRTALNKNVSAMKVR